MQVSLEYTPNGILVVSCLFNGFLSSKKYLGYTEQEALKDFSKDVLGGVPCYA